MTTYVAMLRGINVGGKNRVPMADLREAVGALGYGDVRTYVQSGNVVFTGPDDGAASGVVTSRLVGAVEAAFGLAVPVVVRTGGQLAETLADGPFVKDGLHP
ncbi:MAG TPA: DUF1697 domain-containing protein, partial [Acidimicrobiales bacterium]|nr:DUF1697 domain-containing protein [Acidimicrobiales bacterium]